ncbi:MAG: hypothetical protein GX660_05635 [Clostridiaceae bacterium]|nr:hypothetical protein [Clostridiaceae bacterium]
MKRFIAAILFFCVSISFALFNVTQSSAAVSTSPKINAFDTPKAGESLTVTWNAVAGANKYYIGLLDITNGNVDCLRLQENPFRKPL